MEDGLPTWVCELMVSKSTIDEAISYVKKMEEEIQAAMVRRHGACCECMLSSTLRGLGEAGGCSGKSL